MRLSSKAAKMGPDWSYLTSELLILISEMASTTNIQYVHLRAVCKAWRQALTPNPRHLPRQNPWLLLPLDARCRIDVDDFHLSFYDLSQSRTHRFVLPYVRDKHVYGSYYGWLVLVRDKRVSLHNPITRSSIELPSLDAPPTILSAAFSKRESTLPYVGKVMLSCNPSERGCVVVAWLLYQSKWELGLCRIGDTHWTGVKMMDMTMSRMLLDFTCDNKSVYMVNIKGELLAYDLESLAMRTFPSKINFNAMHDRINLVEGVADAEADGPLVVITTEYLGKLKQIYVCKWINNEQRWCRVKNIGKSVLFLSHYDCSKLQLEDQHGNEIYYDRRHYVDMGFRIGINKIIMQSGYIFLHCPSPTEVFPTVSGFPSWFTPSLI
ncbi:putative F-box protein At2g33200 [Carex rostrata]